MTATEIVTLGCRLNLSESERLRRILASERNLIVINSCAVTNEAMRQTRQAIRRARRSQPDARLIVTGCAAEIERDQLAAMPEVDGLVPNTAKLDPRVWNAAESPEPAPQRRTRAFVAVQNGCDHACTFCVIPQGRGAAQSLTIEQALQAIESHLESGTPEIVLTGVDLTSWGHDLPGQPGLGTLVEAILDRFPELPRLRLSSVDGIEIDPLLFDLLAGERRIMPHLHLSLQHGADLILKRMKRRHLRKDAVDLVTRLKQHRPEFAIGADLIAGFPTENDGHHRQNISIVEELQIVHGHIFPYSPRPGTPAARMPQHDKHLIRQRAADMRAKVAKQRADWLASLVGKPCTVLAERDGTGYAENFARVATPGIEPGTIATLTPTRIEDDLLT
ncbi:MAG: MiaB/RimO family radical SAM methylthiotransferase [Sphingomonadaceae bacterium]